MEETTANVQKESMAGMEIGRPPFRYIQAGEDTEKNRINIRQILKKVGDECWKRFFKLFRLLGGDLR